MKGSNFSKDNSKMDRKMATVNGSLLLVNNNTKDFSNKIKKKGSALIKIKNSHIVDYSQRTSQTEQVNLHIQTTILKLMMIELLHS